MSILDNFQSQPKGLATILQEYAELGFSLHEPDDHVLLLKYKGETIMEYDQFKVTMPMIRGYCYYHLHYVLNMDDQDKLKMLGVIK